MVAIEKLSQIVGEIYRRNYLCEAPDCYEENAGIDRTVEALFFEGDLPSCLVNLMEIAVKLTGGEGYAVVPEWTGCSGVYRGMLKNGQYEVEELFYSYQMPADLGTLVIVNYYGEDGTGTEVRPTFPAVLLYEIPGREFPVEFPVLSLPLKGYWFNKFSELERFLRETLCTGKGQA